MVRYICDIFAISIHMICDESVLTIIGNTSWAIWSMCVVSVIKGDLHMTDLGDLIAAPIITEAPMDTMN